MNIPNKPREIVSSRVTEAANYIETMNCVTHAKLILTGLQSNKQAYSLLCLAAAYEKAEKESIRQIAGVPMKRFHSVWSALRSCGAIVPNPDLLGNVDELGQFYEQLDNARPQWQNKTLNEQRDFILERWRVFAGEKIEPRNYLSSQRRTYRIDYFLLPTKS